MGNKQFSIRPFEKLNKKIQHAERLPSLPSDRQPPPKTKEQASDDELFSAAMQDVQEIEAFRGIPCGPRTRKNPVMDAAVCDPDQEALGALVEIAQGRRPIPLPDTQEYVEWTNPDYGNGVTERLHEGRFSVEAFLDLHGCTVPEAVNEVEGFIREMLRKGLRCVKIIHGRGLRSVKGARIKEAVVKQLAGRHRKKIIAYVTARQCDGGLGALYVLLRKR